MRSRDEMPEANCYIQRMRSHFEMIFPVVKFLHSVHFPVTKGQQVYATVCTFWSHRVWKGFLFLYRPWTKTSSSWGLHFICSYHINLFIRNFFICLYKQEFQLNLSIHGRLTVSTSLLSTNKNVCQYFACTTERLLRTSHIFPKMQNYLSKNLYVTKTSELMKQWRTKHRNEVKVQVT